MLFTLFVSVLFAIPTTLDSTRNSLLDKYEPIIREEAKEGLAKILAKDAQFEGQDLTQKTFAQLEDYVTIAQSDAIKKKAENYILKTDKVVYERVGQLTNLEMMKSNVHGLGGDAKKLLAELNEKHPMTDTISKTDIRKQLNAFDSVVVNKLKKEEQKAIREASQTLYKSIEHTHLKGPELEWAKAFKKGFSDSLSKGTWEKYGKPGMYAAAVAAGLATLWYTVHHMRSPRSEIALPDGSVLKAVKM